MAQAGASPPPEFAVVEANTDSFFDRRVEPQWGHWVPSQLLLRTSNSLSLSHCSQ
jgi:hypothetical protein